MGGRPRSPRPYGERDFLLGPLPRVSPSTPRTKTCPRGPRPWAILHSLREEVQVSNSRMFGSVIGVNPQSETF
jgi:hypothetical protein